MIINSFKNEYSFLSNFYPCVIKIWGLTFRSVEAAFQAAKTFDDDKKLLLTNMTASQSKRAGRLFKLRNDWEKVKITYMGTFLRQKFTNPTLARLLFETNDAVLVEGNLWHDNIWGACTCNLCKDKPKLNHLGVLLMKIRKEIKGGLSRSDI